MATELHLEKATPHHGYNRVEYCRYCIRVSADYRGGTVISLGMAPLRQVRISQPCRCSVSETGDVVLDDRIMDYHSHFCPSPTREAKKDIVNILTPKVYMPGSNGTRRNHWPHPSKAHDFATGKKDARVIGPIAWEELWDSNYRAADS